MTTPTKAAAVLIDGRLPTYLHNVTVDDAPVVVTELAAGSILITLADGALIAIDRVPADSLPHAIRQDTLAARAAALRQLTPWAYVVIVGSLLPLAGGHTGINGSPTQWAWSAIQGALASVQEIGCVVMHVRGDTEFVKVVETIARRDRGRVRLQPVREALFASPAEQILCAIPGIGEQRAEAILRETGERAVLALVSVTDPAHKASGIGPETIKRARQALGLADGEYLAIDSRN